MARRDRSPPLRASTAASAAVVLAGLLVGAGLVLGAWTGPPSVPEGVAGPQSGAESPLLIAPEDVTYLDRIYREQSHEVVYCGLLEDRRLEPWLARLVATSPHSATFSSGDCPTSRDGLVNIHTHPTGARQLSSTDEVLLHDGGYDYVCVQSGPIVAEPGTETDALSCYTLRRGDTVQVAVVLAGPD